MSIGLNTQVTWSKKYIKNKAERQQYKIGLDTAGKEENKVCRWPYNFFLKTEESFNKMKIKYCKFSAELLAMKN